MPTLSKQDAVNMQNKVDSKKGSGLCLKGSIATIKPKDKGKAKSSKKDALEWLKIVKKKPDPKGLKYIKDLLWNMDILFIEEFKFSKDRKFRADIWTFMKIDYVLVII